MRAVPFYFELSTAIESIDEARQGRADFFSVMTVRLVQRCGGDTLTTTFGHRGPSSKFLPRTPVEERGRKPGMERHLCRSVPKEHGWAHLHDVEASRVERSRQDGTYKDQVIKTPTVMLTLAATYDPTVLTKLAVSPGFVMMTRGSPSAPSEAVAPDVSLLPGARYRKRAATSKAATVVIT